MFKEETGNNPESKAEFTIKPYQDTQAETWDYFVECHSVNGTFLQQRRFLNYHENGRFEDCSIWIYEKQKIAAVCPACVQWEGTKKVFYSHAGSTYGGVILSKEYLRINKIRRIFELLETYLREQGFQKCVLKLTMERLCLYPQDAVKFYLGYSGYQEIRELNLYIDYDSYQEDLFHNFSKMKRRNIKKCLNAGLEFKLLVNRDDIQQFHTIVEKNLLKYHVSPVHTVNEMMDLKKRLEGNIEFYGVYCHGSLIAGTMVFLFPKVRCAHTQYLAADPSCASSNAMTFLYYKTAELYRKREFRYLSWGTVTEHGGKKINWGLANHKEEFGSMCVINSIFEKYL